MTFADFLFDVEKETLCICLESDGLLNILLALYERGCHVILRITVYEEYQMTN